MTKNKNPFNVDLSKADTIYAYSQTLTEECSRSNALRDLFKVSVLSVNFNNEIEVKGIIAAAMCIGYAIAKFED
jgi:hypothetical protein